MAELPFLVVHGWWVSKLLVGACGALGLAVISALRWRTERKQTRLEIEARTAAVCGLAMGPASVRGRLRGRASTTIDPRGVVTRDRGETVTVESEGQHVELRGDIDVVRGSHGRAGWRLGRTFVVRDGDDVVARGTLTQVAGAGGDYRESAGKWVLASGDAPIELCAAHAAVRPPALPPARIAVYVALFSAIGYCLLWAVGATVVKRAKFDERHSQTSIAPFSAYVVASALPHVRDDALDLLEMDLEYGFATTEQTEQLRIELAGLHRGCAARADAELDALRFDDALATARSCGADKEELRALMLLGRYHEAAQKYAREPSVPLAIADGQWPEAAAITTSLLARMKSEPAADPRLEALREQRLQCLALWFRVKTGDPAAASELATLSPSTSVTCAIVHALALPEDQRAAALAAAANLDRDGQLEESIVAEALAWAHGQQDGGTFATDTFSAIEDLTGRTGTDRFLWLSLPTSFGTQDEPIALARFAVLQAVKGDFTGARREIETALARAHDADVLSEIQAVEQAIELHMPGTVAPQTGRLPHPATAPLVALRAGTVPPDLEVITMRCNDSMREALAAAARGDGGPLADQLGTCDMLFEANAQFVLAVAPRVTTHREQLASALRAFHDSYPLGEHLPFSILLEGSLRRDLARLVGDEPTAVRWQRIIDAQARLAGDRTKVEALLLWYDL